jgi:hypothetical protein
MHPSHRTQMTPRCDARDHVKLVEHTTECVHTASSTGLM